MTNKIPLFDLYLFRCNNTKTEPSDSGIPMIKSKFQDTMQQPVTTHRRTSSARTEHETCITPPPGLNHLEQQPIIAETDLLKDCGVVQPT